ncbi:hypothetical protein F4815DRAFT_390664 [Daldinia loculata]|nr:hypothetical protein F4815DRAFT_390664 [Daldinia loculata]
MLKVTSPCRALGLFVIRLSSFEAHSSPFWGSSLDIVSYSGIVRTLFVFQRLTYPRFKANSGCGCHDPRWMDNLMVNFDNVNGERRLTYLPTRYVYIRGWWGRTWMTSPLTDLSKLQPYARSYTVSSRDGLIHEDSHRCLDSYGCNMTRCLCNI